MRAESWMLEDERTPEEIKRQQISSLQQQERDLGRRLEIIREQLQQLLGSRP